MQVLERRGCKKQGMQGVWVLATPGSQGAGALLLPLLHLVCRRRVGKSWRPAWKGSFCRRALLCLCAQSRQGKESTLAFISMLSHMLLQPSRIVYAPLRMWHASPSKTHTSAPPGKRLQTYTYIQREGMVIFSQPQLLHQEAFGLSRKQGPDQNHSQ